MIRSKSIKILTESVVRDQVCLAVLQVLKEKGLKKLTINQVAKSAKIAAGTVYNYFKNKDDLLICTTIKLFEMIYQQQERAVSCKVDPKDKLFAFLEASFVFFASNNDIFNFLDQAQMYLKIDIKDKLDHLHKEMTLLESILQQGIQQGLFVAYDVHRCAEFLHRSMVGVLCINTKLGKFDPHQQAADLSAFWFEWLLKKDKDTE